MCFIRIGSLQELYYQLNWLLYINSLGSVHRYIEPFDAQLEADVIKEFTVGKDVSINCCDY